MTAGDRIWADFNLDENCHRVTDENRARFYLAQLTLAVDLLGRAVTAAAGGNNLEARAIADEVARLSATCRILGARHFYARDSEPLKIDTTDSGFPHFTTMLELAADQRGSRAVLEGIPPVPALKAELADRILKHQGPVRDLQVEISRRIYLESLQGADLPAPFRPGEVVGLASSGGEASGFWSFSTYDRALNRPFLWMLYFGYEGDEVPGFGTPDHRLLTRTAERLASGTSSLLAFANDLDDAVPALHPRMVKRVILGPFSAPGYTADEGPLAELLAAEAERGPFVLRWETETLISDRQTRVGKSLLSKGRLKQIFWIPRELDLSSRGVSRLESSILVPHWLGQLLADRNLAAGHHRYVFDGEASVHGIR